MLDSMQSLFAGFATAVTLENLLFCLVGVVIGMFVGVLPGLGPTAGTAIFIPATFFMEPITAIIMLSGIYYGSMYGGTVTSVLLNVPGEAASVVTCLDGYPLSRQGRAGVALGISAIGSFVGGTVALLVLVLLGPELARQALRFGPPEFFALVIAGLILLVGLMGKSLVKGLLSALIGLSLALVGQDPASGEIRYSFGLENLTSGIEFVAVAMGFFGLSEVLLNAEVDFRQKSPQPPKVSGLLPRREEWSPTAKAIGRGSILGSALGMIPGTSAVLASILSYSLEKKVARQPDRFGKGAVEGVAGPETANNAYSGASLVPLLTLGIPTSSAVAVLLGALVVHGLQPGPQLFQTQGPFVWALIASMFVGNVLLVVMNLPLANVWAKVVKVPYKVLFPIIIIVSVVGMYSLRNNVFDVWLMLAFGLAGYVLKKAEFPLAPIILTFVLGSMLEQSLTQSMVMFDGNFLAIFTRPIAGTIFGFALLVLILSVIASLRHRRIGLEESEA